MKYSIFLLFLITCAFVFLAGCGNECRDYDSICPGGMNPPLPKKAYCTWSDEVKCGGCATYSVLFGRTWCYTKSSGAAASDCDGQCPACKIAIYKAEAICVQDRYSQEDCQEQDCGYYLATITES